MFLKISPVELSAVVHSYLYILTKKQVYKLWRGLKKRWSSSLGVAVY